MWAYNNWLVVWSNAMVWVHTCVFPFYSELCGVRCGTHSTIRGVHTLFTPIDVQHAATEGHLGRGERERKKVKGSVTGEAGKLICISHAYKHMPFTLSTKTTTQIVVFSCCGTLFSIDENDKRQVECSEPSKEGCQPPGLWLWTTRQGVVVST